MSDAVPVAVVVAACDPVPDAVELFVTDGVADGVGVIVPDGDGVTESEDVATCDAVWLCVGVEAWLDDAVTLPVAAWVGLSVCVGLAVVDGVPDCD